MINALLNVYCYMIQTKKIEPECYMVLSLLFWIHYPLLKKENMSGIRNKCHLVI